MNNQLKTAAEESAKEYALQQMQANLDMDSAAQLVCEEDHKAGFLKGAAWVPEVSEDIYTNAWRLARAYRVLLPAMLTDVYGNSEVAFRGGYLASAEHSAKRIAFLETQNSDLRRQCIALQNRCVEYEGQIARLEADMMGKDVAITEALAIIDEREGELKTRGLFANVKANNRERLKNISTIMFLTTFTVLIVIFGGGLIPNIFHTQVFVLIWVTAIISLLIAFLLYAISKP